MTFPAMHPSEAVAPHSARGQNSSLLNQAVAASVHGPGLFSNQALMTKDLHSLIDELKKTFTYEPETGVIRWAASHCKKVKVGAIAGTQDGRGYLVCRYKGIKLRCHRIAWFLTYGRLPVDVIDHINGDRSDNRISNLREVSHSENSENKARALVTNKTGLLGVAVKNGRFSAFIQYNKKSHYLGTFKTAEEAHKAYLLEKSRVHKGYVPSRFAL